jgi:hypothetical protein
MRAAHLRERGRFAEAVRSLSRAGESMENNSHNAMHRHRHRGEEYCRIDLITGVVRRRRWIAVEKPALVAESLKPGIKVLELARRRGFNRELLKTRRRTAMKQSAAGGATTIAG